MADQHRKEFLAINSTVLPLWAAMILFPKSSMTRRVMSVSSPLLTGMSAVYAGLLARAAIEEGLPSDPTDGDAWRQVLASPRGFMAGWTHYLVLDLFVGRWIWQTALAEGRRCRVALTFAMMAGPIGLLIFDLQRRLAPRT